MLLAMPKIDKMPTHRHSISATTAMGGNRSSAWSAREDETLKLARAQGLNWNQIAPKHFPGKTANACRKRHERLMEKANNEEYDSVKSDLLAQAYFECRKEMWSIVGRHLGEKWMVVEQKCMEKGLKNLTQAHRSAQRKQGLSSEGDSGVGVSDPDEDSSPIVPVVARDGSFGHHIYQQPYAGQHHQRVPSIRDMLPDHLNMSGYAQHYASA